MITSIKIANAMVEQLRAENAALAAALVAKDAALQRCTKFTQEDYDALELKPHAALVARLKADARYELANRAFADGIISNTARIELIVLTDSIERGEV